jgi:hypothetical protein
MTCAMSFNLIHERRPLTSAVYCRVKHMPIAVVQAICEHFLRSSRGYLRKDGRPRTYEPLWFKKLPT